MVARTQAAKELFGASLIKREGWIHDGVFDSKARWRRGGEAQKELKKWEMASFGLRIPEDERPGSAGRVDQHRLLITWPLDKPTGRKKKTKRGEGWYGVNGPTKATNLSGWGDG